MFLAALARKTRLMPILPEASSSMAASPDSIDIRLDGEYVELAYHYQNQPFHRIRRITGYLVGTLDRFNNAKRAEERDRVKHGIGLQ